MFYAHKFEHFKDDASRHKQNTFNAANGGTQMCKFQAKVIKLDEKQMTKFPIE